MSLIFSALGALKPETDNPLRNTVSPSKTSVNSEQFKRALEREQATVKPPRDSDSNPTREPRDSTTKNQSAENRKSDKFDSGKSKQTTNENDRLKSPESGEANNTPVNDATIAVVKEGASLEAATQNSEFLDRVLNTSISETVAGSIVEEASSLTLPSSPIEAQAGLEELATLLIPASTIDPESIDANATLANALATVDSTLALESNSSINTLIGTAPLPLAEALISPFATGSNYVLDSGVDLRQNSFPNWVLAPELAVQTGVLKPTTLGDAISGLQAFMDASTLPDSLSQAASGETHGAMIKNQKSLSASLGLSEIKMPLLAGQGETKPDTLLAKLAEKSDLALQKFANFMPPSHSQSATQTNSTFSLASADARVQMPVTIAFGQSGWGTMIAERSAMMVSQNIKFAELQLDPPELGQLQVKVSVNQETGQTSVSFISANPQVRDALEQSVLKLRELLSDQGLNLVDVDVSDQKPQHNQRELQENPSKRNHADAGDQEEGSAPSRSTAQITYGVDHFV